MKKERLFGTDGVRGRFGFFPLDEPSLIRLGRAIGEVYEGRSLIIGRDTRESGTQIEELLARGIAGRCRLASAGVIPTPGLSYLTRTGRYDAGIVISASHNPYLDNGIKLFNRMGEKISERTERLIEHHFAAVSPLGGTPEISRIDGSARYHAFLMQAAGDLDGGDGPVHRLVIDCANGAAATFAPDVFAELGFDFHLLGNQPDGRNINHGVGSTSPASLQEMVTARRADLGIAFDGDADRMVWVDPRGHLLDGDHTLLALASSLLGEGSPHARVVVGTVMTNLGLELTLQKMGIGFCRTDVGDRFVAREMKRLKAIIGGEPSGHTIVRTWQPSGDGILSALMVLNALRGLGITASELYDRLPRFPQKTVSIRVRERRDLAGWEALQRLLRRFHEDHGKNSRLLVRYSGTEAKIRVMMESSDPMVIEKKLDPILREIASQIGE